MGGNLALVSGGLDSKILLAKFKDDIGHALIFDCNRNNEVERALEHANEYGVAPIVVKLPWFDSTKEYPMRNLIFLSYAISEALKNGVKKIYYATHTPPDYDKGYYYEDCSPGFIGNINDFTKKYGLEVVAPFLFNTLEEEIKEGIRLGVDFSDVQICNHEEGNCGACPKCMEALRQLRYCGAKTFPHFNQTIYSVDNTKRKELMLQWLPIHEARLYTNNRCQKTCDFCSYEYSKDAPNEELNVEQWFEVLDKLKMLYIRSIMLSGKEPMIDDNIFPILHRAKELGFQTHINTNGLTLDKYKKLLICNPPDRLLVSLNYEDTYQFIDIMGMLNRYMTVQPYIVVNRQNLNELENMINSCIMKGIDSIYIRFVYPSPFSHKEEKAVIESLKKYPAQFQVPIDYSEIEEWEHYDKYLKGELIREENVEFTFVHNFCQAYWDSLTILHEGSIVGCAKHTYHSWNEMREFSVGNILRMSPKEIIMKCQEKIQNSDLSMCLPKY